MEQGNDLSLHIISSDVPFPPDYGGMVDVFYKIKNLHDAGVKIYLHCFEYGRGRPAQMEAYCEQVFYYKRKTGLLGFSLALPYMMYSRRDDALLRNLEAIDAPILFEGVHTTYYLDRPSLKGRKKIIRNQNLEQQYYGLLAKRKGPLLKKLYYYYESLLLKNKESKLGAADAFFTVAEHDHAFFKHAYPGKTHEYIPSFQPYDQVSIAAGKGCYVLYHGNLGHPENIEAALFLLQEVCPALPDIPFVFAGKDPDPKLYDAVARYAHCRLIANPTMDEMQAWIADAQLHVLPTFQATGLKLKLLHALFQGRHVLVNEEMIAGTGLGAVCEIADDARSFQEKIKQLFEMPFDGPSLLRRERTLLERYDNKANARRILTFLRG